MSTLATTAEPTVSPSARPTCKSCEIRAATVHIRWTDGEEFDVCTACTPEGLIELAQGGGEG